MNATTVYADDGSIVGVFTAHDDGSFVWRRADDPTPPRPMARWNDGPITHYVCDGAVRHPCHGLAQARHIKATHLLRGRIVPAAKMPRDDPGRLFARPADGGDG